VNPFKIFIIIAVVVAVVLFAGFIYTVFFHTGAQPEGLGSLLAQAL
jgi:hypothetical protein